MTKDNTAAAAVAELDSVLNQIKTASARKTAAEMHEQGGGDKGKATSLTSNTPAADDGDRPLAEGERAREDISDVKDQQQLSHENTTGAADSPQFNNAPDETGSVDETDADAEEGKQNQHPDTQHGTSTSHPARTDNAKIAALLKVAEDYENGDYEEEGGDKGEGGGEPKGDYENGEGGEGGGGEPKGDHENGEGGGEPPAPPADPMAEGGAPPLAEEGGAPPLGEEMPPEGGLPADPTMPSAEPSEEELMAIEQLLGGVSPKMAAAVPDIPVDEDGLKKLASEDPAALDTYTEKVAQVYPDEVQNGFNFAANVFASIKQHGTKTAGDNDEETKAQIASLRKQAMGDAGNVAEIVEGVEEGEGMGMEGASDPLAGGEAPLEDEVALGEGGEGGDAAGEAEALLAALQQSGVADDNLMKAAAAAGFDRDRAKAILAKTRGA